MSDEQVLRELPNGAMQDVRTGRIVKAPPPDQRITKDTAPALARRRWELARQSAEAGMLRAAKSLSPSPVENGPEAWGFIVERQTEHAASPDAGAASVRAAEFVGRATHMLEGKQAAAAPAAVNVAVFLSPEAAGYLERLGERTAVDDDEDPE